MFVFTHAPLQKKLTALYAWILAAVTLWPTALMRCAYQHSGLAMV